MPQTTTANCTTGTAAATEAYKEHENTPMNQGTDPIMDIDTTENGERDTESIEGQNQSLVLEEYRFVPYIDTSPPLRSEPLKQYATDCFNYAMKFLEEWIMRDESDFVPNKEILIDVLARRRPRGSINFENLYSGLDCGLAKAMQRLFRLPLACNMSEKVNSLLNDCQDIFYSDKLLASLHTTDILKPCIDIVAENISAETTVALEVGGVQNALYHRIMSIVACFPSKPIIYKVAHTGVAAEFPETVSIVTQDQLLEDSSLQDQAVDLLILNHVLHKQENIDACLEKYSKLLKEGGFLLVKEVTGNFPLCLVMEALSENAEYPRTRADRIFGRYLDGSGWSKLFSLHGFDVIYERTDGVFATLFLLRKRMVQTRTTNPMIFSMNELHFPWLEDLIAKMRKMETSPKDSRLWLLARKGMSGVTGFLKCVRGEAGGDNLRGILISNLIPSSQEPQVFEDNPDLQWLVQRDLTQNVFRDGTWGSFRHIPLRTGVCTGSQAKNATCDPDKSYIVVTWTDNQGVGLALVQWLADRGAQKILLCSSSGFDKAQTARMAECCHARGLQLNVSSRNVITVDGAWGLVNQAQTLAPLGGVFNLHSARRSKFFLRHTRESFQEVCDPKVQGTVNLDHVTRTLCRDSLRWFVVLSCASAGRGRKGHTSSGFSSSVVERICEKRQADKLPGLAIQVGHIRSLQQPSNQGLSQDKSSGDLMQDIPSFLVTLDVLLAQESCPVVSSVMEKPLN